MDAFPIHHGGIDELKPEQKDQLTNQNTTAHDVHQA
jgi:hypothetical protein